MPEENLQTEKHACGVCGAEFNSEQEYLDHQCVTGYTPTDPAHLGEGFEAVSNAANQRGTRTQELMQEGKSFEEAQAMAAEEVGNQPISK